LRKQRHIMLLPLLLQLPHFFTHYCTELKKKKNKIASDSQFKKIDM
jgi:hypothetical protein